MRSDDLIFIIVPLSRRLLFLSNYRAVTEQRPSLGILESLLHDECSN
jgi:hypothetical protein